MTKVNMLSVVATFVPGCIAFMIGVIFVVRMRKEKEKDKDLFLPRNKSMIGFVMLSIGFVLYTPVHPGLISRIISITFVHLGGLIVCVSTHDILIPNKPAISRRIILTIVAMSIMTNVFDILRGANDGLFLKGESFEPNFIYLCYCCFLLSTITLICFMLSRIHWIALREYKAIAVRIRMYAMTIFHGLNVFNSIFAQANLLLYCFGFGLFFMEANVVFYLLLNLNFVLILCVFLPDRLFLRITKPISNLMERKEAKIQMQLELLHDFLVHIVPVVQLDGGRFSKERLFVEISHARRIIWSHGSISENPSAMEEARSIYYLNKQKKVFMDAGPYSPPPKPIEPQKYYIDLAHFLEKEIVNFMSNKVPSVQGWPIIGNLLGFLYNRLALLEQISRECGDIGTARIGPDTIVLLNNPDYIREVLVDYGYDGVKPKSVRDSFRPAIGDSLLVIEGDLHRKRRKVLAPHFQHRNVILFAEAMSQSVDELQDTWVNGDVVNINNEMLGLTLDMVGKTFFGVNIKVEASELGESLEVVAKYVNDYLSLPIRTPSSWPTRRNNQYKRAISLLNHIIDRMIVERYSEHKNNDILSILLNARDEETSGSLSPEEAREEILSLFLGGNDTTRHALVWMWYLLAQNPNALQKLQDEINATLKGRKPQFADLSQMPYSLQVVKEVLRIYSPVYIIVRSLTRSVTIGGKYQIPAGYHFVISPYTLHRRTDYYPEPEQFNPDRFEPSQERPRYAYLPFGTGPHTCIGSHFAMLALQMTLVTIAQRVTLTLEPNQIIKPLTLTTLQPDKPIYMRVRRR